MSPTETARLLGRFTAALVADVSALVVSFAPRRHRHAWVPSDRARGSWHSEPGLDICVTDPRHTRRRP